jgi:hypothetical protein
MPDRVKQSGGMVVQPVEDVFGALELERVVERPLQRDPDIVVYRKMREDQPKSGTIERCRGRRSPLAARR